MDAEERAYSFMTDIDSLHPWRAGRPGIRALIAASARPSVEIALPYYRGDLAEVAGMEDVLAARVEPVWDSLKGKDAAEIAGRMLALVRDLADAPTRESSIRLYQLFLADYVMPWSVWTHLRQTLQDSPLAGSAPVHEYFLSWVRHSPDGPPIDAALFMLANMRLPPPLALMLELGRHGRLVAGTASVIAAHHGADEDGLIELAAQHRFAARLSALGFLRSVTRLENREWLLTEGYDSGLYQGGLDYEPCAYFAAVHGRLLERLQDPEVPPDRLAHYARSLAIMAQASGGASSWRTLDHYADGPHAVERLFHHITRAGQPADLHRELKDILCFLHNGPADDDSQDALWPNATCRRLYALGRLLFEPPLADDTAVEQLWWERPKPTIDDLKAGDLGVLDKVLDDAEMSDDDGVLAQVVAWATDYLALETDPQARELRAAELGQVRMPGVCKGGLAGVTHQGLGSVYGQVLLQIVLALQGRTPMGWPLLRASLETDFPHLPGAAADVLAGWPDGEFPREANAVLHAALARADDEAVRDRLEKAVRNTVH